MLEISVQTGGLQYNDQNADEVFGLIANAGFTAIDFNIDPHLPPAAITKGPLTDFFNQSVEDLIDYYRPVKEAAEKNGIAFGQMHAPFPLWVEGKPEVNAYMITVVEKCVALCQYLGCTQLVVHPVTRPTKEEEREVNFAMYRAMIPFARGKGVKLCLENLPHGSRGRTVEGICCDAAEVCTYLDTLNAEAGEELFGFCFDLGHANILGLRVRDFLVGIGHRLTCLHLHDNNGTSDWHTAPYTCISGAYYSTDWEGLLQGLSEIDYRGTLNFETFRATKGLPRRLQAEMLHYIAQVGYYFKDRILGKE
jgi:sugar phosphate isomerase/epimerase